MSFLALASLLFLAVSTICSDIQFAYACFLVFSRLFSHFFLPTSWISFYSSSSTLLISTENWNWFLMFSLKTVVIWLWSVSPSRYTTSPPQLRTNLILLKLAQSDKKLACLLVLYLFLFLFLLLITQFCLSCFPILFGHFWLKKYLSCLPRQHLHQDHLP